jgi:hypothetical protein
LTTILKATYTDSLRQENEEYFLVLGGSVQRMERADGQSQWERMKSVQVKVRSIDIDDMSKRESLQAWLASVHSRWEEAK